MQITIDTNKDSKEHIQHMIDFLQRFVGASVVQQEMPEAPGGAFNMFGAEGGVVPEQPKPDDDEPILIEDFSAENAMAGQVEEAETDTQKSDDQTPDTTDSKKEKDGV